MSKFFWLLAVVAGSVMLLHPAARGHEPAPIRVMSFNVRYANRGDGENAWPNRREMAIGLIHTYDPDILGLQEPIPAQMDEIEAALPHHVLVGCGRDDGKRRGEFTALLLRRERFEIREQGRFWYSATPDEPGSKGFGAGLPRLCVWTRVADKQNEDREFLAYNTHFDHQSRESRQHAGMAIAEHLADHAHDLPVVVMGDFNTTIDSAPLQAMTNGAVKLFDTYAEFAEAGKSGTFHGFAGGTAGARIDYIFATSDWTIKQAAIDYTNVDGRYPSDHFPVTATLQLAALNN